MTPMGSLTVFGLHLLLILVVLGLAFVVILVLVLILTVILGLVLILVLHGRILSLSVRYAVYIVPWGTVSVWTENRKCMQKREI